MKSFLSESRSTQLIPLSSITKIVFRDNHADFHYCHGIFNSGIIQATYNKDITKTYMVDKFETSVNSGKTIIEL